jgi:hypothetical protein
MNKSFKFKMTFLSVVLVALLGIMLILIYRGYKDQHIQLSNLERHTGKVISVGKTQRKASTSTVFYMQLEGLSERVGLYRISKNYDDLINDIKIGDKITIYFKAQNGEDLNIELVQIEKEGKIVLDKSEYIAKQSSLIWVGSVGFILLGFTLFRILKIVLIKK